MKKIPPRTISVLEPKDKSLEAYKAWIQGIANQLASKPEIEWTEAQWIGKWKKYWQKRAKRGSESGPNDPNAE